MVSRLLWSWDRDKLQELQGAEKLIWTYITCLSLRGERKKRIQFTSCAGTYYQYRLFCKSLGAYSDRSSYSEVIKSIMLTKGTAVSLRATNGLLEYSMWIWQSTFDITYMATSLATLREWIIQKRIHKKGGGGVTQAETEISLDHKRLTGFKRTFCLLHYGHLECKIKIN
jgi:hypothetical protein